MLYLFNSAFRPLYAANNLNTLSLPTGSTNEYRYRYTGDSRNISADFYSSLRNLDSGHQCVLIFIDRFAEGGYRYHPLRFAKFVLLRQESDYVFFRVQFSDYVYPRDLSIFNRDLVDALRSKGLPVLTDNDPSTAHDGFYAIQSASIFGDTNLFEAGDRAWLSAVDGLVSTRAYRTDDEQSPVFTRVVVKEKASTVPVTPRLRDGMGVFALKKGKMYDLVISYRYPRQRIDQSARSAVKINCDSNLRLLGQSSLNIDSNSNSLALSFVSVRYLEDTTGSIALAVADPMERPNVLLTGASIPYEITEPIDFWVKIAIALVVLSAVNALMAVDWSVLHPFSISALVHAARLKFLLGGIQSLILFWAFRLIGEKIF